MKMKAWTNWILIKIRAHYQKIVLFFAPFAACPCEKHLVVNTLVGASLIGGHHLALRYKQHRCKVS